MTCFFMAENNTCVGIPLQPNHGIAATGFTGAVTQDVILFGNKIVVRGAAGTSFAIARFNDVGGIDNSFKGDGKLITDFPDADSATGLA